MQRRKIAQPRSKLSSSAEGSAANPSIVVRRAFFRRCRAATPSSQGMPTTNRKGGLLQGQGRPTGERALSCRSNEHAPNETHGRSCFKSKSWTKTALRWRSQHDVAAKKQEREGMPVWS